MLKGHVIISIMRELKNGPLILLKFIIIQESGFFNIMIVFLIYSLSLICCE